MDKNLKENLSPSFPLGGAATSAEVGYSDSGSEPTVADNKNTAVQPAATVQNKNEKTKTKTIKIVTSIIAIGVFALSWLFISGSFIYFGQDDCSTYYFFAFEVEPWLLYVEIAAAMFLSWICCFIFARKARKNRISAKQVNSVDGGPTNKKKILPAAMLAILIPVAAIVYFICNIHYYHMFYHGYDIILVLVTVLSDVCCATLGINSVKKNK